MVRPDILPCTSITASAILTFPLIVLPHHVKPSLSIHLSYPPAHDHVSLGNTIPTSNVTSRPSFEIHTLSSKPTPTEKNTTYTLVLTDPDATSRADPVKAQMCHWIITGFKLHSKHKPESNPASFRLDTVEDNYQGNAIGRYNSGLTELMSYIPPSPPPKTGYHRYVFVLLAPKDPKDSGKKLEKPKDRPHWGYGKVGAGVREWAKDNGLVAVGKYIVILSLCIVKCGIWKLDGRGQC